MDDLADLIEWDLDSDSTPTPPSGTRTTDECEPKRVSDIAERLRRKLETHAADPEYQAAVRRREEEEQRKRREFEERQRRYAQEERERRVFNAVGDRYRNCTLDNFRCETDAQRQVVRKLRDFAEDLPARVKAGEGLILYGPAGAGKDHLLVATLRLALAHGIDCVWENGTDLYSEARDAITKRIPESEMYSRLTGDRLPATHPRPTILAISDPLPPVGALTDFQAAFILRILDRRYRDLMPVWMTVNVTGREELEERMGVQNADRIIHGATALFCDWPTHRQTRKDK